MSNSIGMEYFPKVNDIRPQAQSYTKFLNKPKKKYVRMQSPTKLGDHYSSINDNHKTAPFTSKFKQDSYSTS